MKRNLLVILILSLFVSGTVSAEAPPERLKILGLSLLLPGLGHMSLGHNHRATAYMSAEAALWTAAVVFQVQGHIRKDSYVEYAEIHAGIADAANRSSDYYRRIGRYPNTDIYHDEIRRDARARYRDDLEARAKYFARNRVPDDQVWSWDSYDARQRYRKKRSDSNAAFKRAGYMVGVGLANRLLAAVDVMRLAHKRQKGTAVNLSIRPDLKDPGSPARFCVTVSFP